MPCWYGNKILFFIVFFTTFIITIFIIILHCILVYIVFFNKKIKKYQILLNIIKVFLFFITKIGFLPLQSKYNIKIVGICSSIILCNMKIIFNEPLYSCKTVNYYFIYLPISIIFSLLIIILSLLFTKFSFKKNEKVSISIAKYSIMNSSFIFLLIQPFAIIMKIFSEKHDFKNIIIYYLFISSSVLIYYSYYEHKYQNNEDIEETINYYLCFVYCWICTCLLFGHITKINGMFYPLLMGIIIIFLIFKYIPRSKLKMDRNIYFHSDLKLFNHLRLLINAIVGQNKRENNLNLLNYFFTYLKTNDTNYFEDFNDTSAEEIKYLFFKYIENTFRRYNQVFKKSIPLRIMNAFFLMNCLGQYSKAYMLFYSLLEENNNLLTYSQEFFIFRQKKYLENKIFEDGSDPTNISTFFQINTFIKLTSNISELYAKFWITLLQLNENENINRLYTLGSEICEYRDEIEYVFKHLSTSHIKDKKIFFIYGYYLKEILNDQEGALQYLKNSDLENYQELNLGNVDVTRLNTSSDFQYIIVSGKKSNFGVIEKASLGFCNITGYPADKVIGQNANLFLPKFLHKPHDNLLINTVKEFHKKYNLTLGKITNTFYHNVTFVKTCSKYLYPLPIIIGVTIDENFDCIIFGRVDFNTNFNIIEYLNKTCRMIVDQNLIIQEVTANSTIYFENNNFGKKNIDVTSIIDEFFDEFDEESVKNPNMSKLEIKKLILRKNYMQKKPTKIVTVKNKTFKMNCYELIIGPDKCGYHFNFEIINDFDKFFELSVDPGNRSPSKRRFSITNFSAINKELSSVNSNYIPEGKQFFFNVEKKTFYPKIINQENKKELNSQIQNYFHDSFIKKLRAKKGVTIKNNTIQIESSLTSDSDENESSYSISEYTEKSSEIISDSLEKNKVKNEIKSFEESNVYEINDNDYYKVQYPNMSFLMFDFDKQHCVNVGLPPFINKIEEIFYYEKNKKLPTSKNESKNKKTNIYNLNEINDLMKNNYIENIFIRDMINEKIKTKTINKSVLIHCIIFLFSNITLLIMFLIFGIQTYYEHLNLCLITESLIEYSNLSIDAYKMIFSSTELFITTNEKYTNIKLNRENYSNNILSQLFQFYNQSFTKFQKLKTYNIKLSSYYQKFIDDFNVKLYIISNNFSLHETNTKLPYLINEYFENIYEICFLPLKKRIFTNKNYNFIFFNTDNGFSDGTRNYTQIYIEYFYTSKKELKMINYIYLLFYFIIGIICCFFEIYSYLFIIKEKKIKVSFFFRMTKEQISICYKKCQHFRIISNENLNKPSNLIKTPNINFDLSDAYNTDDNETSNLLNENINFFQLKNEDKSINTNNKKIKIKFMIKKEQIYYIIILIILFGILIFISYNSDFIYLKVYNYLLIHYSVLQHGIYFFKSYSYLRMYIIYENYINSKPYLKERLNMLLEFLNTGHSRNSGFFNEIHRLIKEYGLPKKSKQIFDNLSHKNICSYIKFEDTNLNCFNFADGILLKGFEPLSTYLVDSFSYFISEVNKSYEKAKKKNYTYNEVLYGTEEYKKNLPINEEKLKDYQINNPFLIFNKEEMLNMVLLINEIFFPVLSDFAFSINKEINELFDSLTLYIIATILCIIIFVFIFSLTFIVPIIIKQNREINKIRRMLEIIPKDIIFRFFLNDENKNN